MVNRVEQVLAQRRMLNRLQFPRLAIGTSIMLHLLLLAGMFITSILSAIEEPIQYVDVMVVTPEAMSPPPAKDSTPDKPVQEQPQPPTPEPEPERTILPAEEPEPTPPEPDPEPEPQPQETVDEPPTPNDDAQADDEGTSTDPGDPNDRLGPVRITGFDDPNFNYGYYIDRMLEAIRSQWLRPPVGNDVENVVHFYIRADGAIEALEMVEPSGVTSFDMAGMRAVRSARLPPLPRSYRRQRLGVTLIFR